MVKEIVILHFNITDFGKSELLDASFDGHGNILFSPPGHTADCPFDPLGESVVIHRLKHVIHRIDGIALHDVLRHIGDKNDYDFAVKLSNFFCSCHAVHETHGDIHQDQIVICLIGSKNLIAVRKDGNAELLPAFFFILVQITEKLLSVFYFIIYKSDVDHGNSSPLAAYYTKLA